MLAFQQLSGCSVEEINENISIIESAKFSVESILDEEKIQPTDLPRCEYAVGAVALYDFVCKQASREKIIVTPAGQTSENGGFAEKIKASGELKKTALNNLRGIVIDTDFFFKTTEG